MALNCSGQTSTQPNTQLPLFGAQQISPADSATNSSNNASPTSPRSHHHLQYHVPGQVRQLRPMKSPLYVPAALRPTERPNKDAPMTPPKSLHGSLDSLEDAGQSNADRRKAPLDLVVENNWVADEILGDVTGGPSRDHWKADQQSPNCDSPQCRNSFNLFRRRHHCRHCGHIFCAEHSSFNIPLNQDARFHPDGISSRACDTCHRHYQKWDTARSLKRQNSDNSQSDPSKNDPPTPLDGSSGKRGLISPSSNSEQTVGSVPKDWAWSTF